MYTGIHVKYPIFMSDFSVTIIVSDIFSKNTQLSNLMKIRPLQPSCLFHADGLTDMTQLMVAFRNFTKTPKKKVKLPCAGHEGV